MDVIDRGPEPRQVAIVSCIHGDERSGSQALVEVLDEVDRFEKGVKFVIANEEARQQDVRSIDEDLNRVFPGDSTADTHERRLAAELVDELAGLDVLDLHTTVSYDEPVAFVKGWTNATKRLAISTGVPRVVDVETEDGSDDFFAGSLIEAIGGVAVECGLKQSDKAVRNAKTVVRDFLAARGVLPEPVELPDSVQVFRLIDRVDEPTFGFTATNFERVPKDTVYARDGDDRLLAERTFYPVLMSTEGYDEVLGYRAEKVSTLNPRREDTTR